MIHSALKRPASGLFFTKSLLFFAIIQLASSAAFGQSCIASSTFPTVRVEGLAEAVGDVTLNCTGGTSGAFVQSFLAITLNATITNRLDANGNFEGIYTTVNTGGGAVASGLPPAPASAASLTINGMSYTVPVNNQQQVVFRISGIRVAVPSVSGGSAPYISASIAGGGVNISNGTNLTVGYPSTSLYSSTVDNGIPCAGSALPTTISFAGMIAGNVSSSAIRLTEGFQSAFVPKAGVVGDGAITGVDTGIRFIVQLSGYGPNAQVYVPDAIVGSDGTAPTSGGAFGSSINSGTYTPGLNQLLLARVNGADATGLGGTLAVTIPGSATAFSSVTQIALTGGSGYVVYEVLDANPQLVESLQVPVFLVVPAGNCAAATPALNAMPAPTSTVATATQTDPIPRFVATAPASDCKIIGDCSAPYFPQLDVQPPSITLSGSSEGQPQNAFIDITNGGSSQLEFTATTTYQTASGLSNANWLSINGTTGTSVTGVINPINGITSVSLPVVASPATLLVPGTYQATVAINAGSAGTTTVAVTFTVAAAGPVIQAVVNAANFQVGPVTAGSFVSIFGMDLAAKQTASVTFNGFPGTISYDGQPSSSSTTTQINVLVPANLGSATSAGVIATIDGKVSNTFALSLTQNAPAVFTPGILNQDNSVNLATAPASDGDYVQIFLTGLTTPVAVPVTVTLGSATGLTPAYVGPVVSIPGLEQVNVQVPPGFVFSGGAAPLSICIPGTGTTQLCSVPVSLYLH